MDFFGKNAILDVQRYTVVILDIRMVNIMYFTELLEQKHMTKYRLSKMSGVPYSTIADICNGKSDLANCSAETVYLLSKALDISMEFLLELSTENGQLYSFDVYKSTVCHEVKNLGDLQFIINTLKENKIRDLYNKRLYPEALYLLAMLDYLSRENGLPICTNYDDIRACRLKKPVFPNSVIALSLVDASAFSKAEENAIPEFKRFNIIEADVRNIA